MALLKSVATSAHRSRSGAKRTRYARRETYRSWAQSCRGHGSIQARGAVIDYRLHFCERL
jgi:hypothetical protein